MVGQGVERVSLQMPEKTSGEKEAHLSSSGPSLSWAENQGRRKMCEVGREQGGQGCLCNLSRRYHFKEGSAIQKVHLPMIKLTTKYQKEPKTLHPMEDPLKWQRLKVRDHGGREDRETPFLWMPLP